MQRLEGFFRSFDMFSAPATLRAKGSSSVTRTSAGVISFIFFCYFAYIFIHGMYKIFTFQSILSSQTFEKIPLTQIYAENFMFGVGNLKLDQEVLRQEFSIKTLIVSNNKGVIDSIAMAQCDPKQWQKLGEDYEQQFRLHYLDRFVCPTQPEKLKLINSTLLEEGIFFQILIEPANARLSSKMREQLKLMDEFETNKFNLFYLDQAVIPNEEQAIQFFVNINHFAYFSSFKRHKTLIRLSNFKVSTDYSLIPVFTDYQIKTGYTISDAVITDVDSALEAQNSKITFELTNDLYIYNRKVGKIDEMFSYAGGLFALVIWCLAFFVAPFNQYRYELMVAQSTFNFDKDGNKFREKQFNFLIYMKYSLYKWTYQYLCFKPKWKDCMKIEETIAEANDQMDVMRLFRKLQFLEMALIHNTNESENFIIALTEPRTLSEVREQRLILEYYFFIIKGEPAATVEDAIDGNAKRFKNLREPAQKYETDSVSIISQQRMINPNQEIKQKLMEYLNLDKEEGVCEAIASYPVALQQSKSIILSDQLNKVESHLTEYFLKLKPAVKKRIMMKIPLKIIHRLCLRSEEMRNRSMQGEQSKQSKKA